MLPRLAAGGDVCFLGWLHGRPVLPRLAAGGDLCFLGRL